VSFDLEVWSVLPCRTIDLLPNHSDWVRSGLGWVYREKAWQLLIEESVEVGPEDVPHEIGPRIVGISFLTRVSVEPGHAPKSALTLQQKVVRAMAKACRGLVYDPQTNQVFGATTHPRPAPKVSGESIELLTMSWWFSHGPLTERRGLNELILYFERYLPEFLPSRYGDYEPAKFRFDRGNFDHFADAAFNGPLIFVWDTVTPAASRTRRLMDRLGDGRLDWVIMLFAYRPSGSVVQRTIWRILVGMSLCGTPGVRSLNWPNRFMATLEN
jgi:hypothetical protein